MRRTTFDNATPFVSKPPRCFKLSNSIHKHFVTLAEAVPEDHIVLKRFKGWYQGSCVEVTAVLERTCVILLPNQDEKKLVNKHLLFVEEGFTLAVLDAQKVAMRNRVQRGWRTNWRRREARV